MKTFHELIFTYLGTPKGEQLNLFPWLRYFGHPVYPILLKICTVRDKLYDRFFEASKDIYDPHADGPSLMQAINQLLDTSSPHYDATVSVENARGLFADLLIASSATTIDNIYAMINILLHNPQVLHCLQIEIDTVIGERQPSVKDQKNTPYVTATIYEVLRYSSLVPTFPHKTTENVVLGGYDIPAGVVVLPLFKRLNHDESFWKKPIKISTGTFSRRSRIISTTGSSKSKARYSVWRRNSILFRRRFCNEKNVFIFNMLSTVVRFSTR